MVRKPYIDKKGLKRGAWSEEEDNKLRTYILRYKAWNWNHLPRFAGLARCGKSCRMRWENYLKPGVKRGGFSKDDEELILKMQKEHGNKWSLIAKRMPGRTDNEIKNYWHTILSMRIKQNQNSIVFMENDVEPSEEEMHGVDETKNNVSDHESSIQDKEQDGSFSEIILSEGEPSKPYLSLDESVSMTTTSTMLMDDASHNKNFPTTNGTVSSYEETLLVNSSNTEKAPTYTSFTLTEDMILNLEESFFAAPESFTLEPFQLMDKDKYSYSSSSSSDFCPSLMNFPSSSCKSRLDTHDSWSPDESVSTEPSSTDASNTPFLQLETSTLLGRLDSLESFGFWKALWNILK